MRSTRKTILLPVLLMLVAVGCQTSAEQRLAIANDSFASTLDALSDARESGAIDDRTQTEIIAPARRIIDGLLDRAYLAVERGESMKLQEILREIDKELTPLLRERFKLKRQEK